MHKDEDFGTNADGGRNLEYCHYCFENGHFTEDQITAIEMADKVAAIMAQMGTPSDQARAMAHDFIPKLKRWSGM
jgi:hypothetical protein